MGDRWRPKSDPGGSAAGTASGPQAGRDDPSGRGTYDEATGLWDWYEDVPEELTAAGAGAWEWTADQALNEWYLIEGEFDDRWGYDLSELLHTKTWRWFWVRLRYLMSTDSAIRRRLAPPPEPAEVVNPDGS